MKQSGKLPTDKKHKKKEDDSDSGSDEVEQRKEKVPKFQILDDSDDSQSYLSQRSYGYDKNLEEIEAFLNRPVRGGDMSPFRTK